jgi:ECF transporter S component (folate family)
LPKTSRRIRNIVISAVFLSIALSLKLFFSLDSIPLFGENGMRIGVSSTFSAMPAILFGPLYGAVTSALLDILGFIIKPTGSFLPYLTASAALGGFLRGFLWNILKNKNEKNIRLTLFIIALTALFLGLLNIFFLNDDGITPMFYANANASVVPDLSQMHYISSVLIRRTINSSDPAGSISMYITVATAGLIGFALFCIVLLAADLMFSKRISRLASSSGGKTYAVQILSAMLISGFTVTTLNTVSLREFLYESWQLLPFSVVWMPRVIEEIVMSVVNSYFIITLYMIAKKTGLVPEKKGTEK